MSKKRCLDKGLVIKYLDERLENVVEQINDGAVQNVINI